MAENILYKKISKGLMDICDKQKIGHVDRFCLIIDIDGDILLDRLHQQLQKDLPKNISKSTTIVMKKRDIKVISAVIYNVEGEKI